MNFLFHPDAEAELLNAVDYYEDCQPGLGHDFALEVSLSIERILLYPEAWPEVDKDIRRTLLKRFPYGLLYSVIKEKVVILAIMNLHREPGYWKKRKS